MSTDDAIKLPWSKDPATFALLCHDALCRRKVRRGVVCDVCGQKWEAEYDRATGVQKREWYCECGHKVVDYFVR